MLPQVGLRGTWRQDAVGGAGCAKCPDLITQISTVIPSGSGEQQPPQKGLENKKAPGKPPRTEVLCRDPEPPCDLRNRSLTFFFRHRDRGLDVSASRMEPLGRVSAQESGLARAAGAGHWNAIPVATQRRDPQTSLAQHLQRIKERDKGGSAHWGFSRCRVAVVLTHS